MAEMVRRLRQLHGRRAASNGLVLGNGGVLTTENTICLSTQPDKSHKPYPLDDRIPARVVAPPITSEVTEEEAAVIEVRIARFP